MNEVASVKKYVHKCLLAFAAMLVLTGASVSAYYLGFSSTQLLCLILGLSLAQGLLVLGYFMDLFSEKALIFWVLLFTAIFFLGCLFLPVAQHLSSLDTGHVS
jgi:heme/copper-type cytochrome/quinol oxidase subunit 4